MYWAEARSTYLCNEIKKQTRLKVYAGPVEATAIGNICTQLIRQKRTFKQIGSGKPAA